MARISIELPASFPFVTSLPVRITDLNYGSHVGNDTILSFIHEARVRFLAQYGYREDDLGGVGMIMGNVAIVYKNELFYGDNLHIHVSVTNLSRASFDLVYKLEKEKNGSVVDVAHAKTGMVCFNYTNRKVVALPEEVRLRWQ